MSSITVNGASALRGEITIPRTGAWTANVSLPRLSEAVAIAGPVTVAIGSVTLHGVVVRSGENVGEIWARLQGGAGGLGKPVSAKTYRGVPARLAISEMLTEAGETLSPTSDADVLATMLQFWSRRQQTAGMALASVLETLGRPGWRVLPDGSVRVGGDAWVASRLTDYTYESNSPQAGFVDLLAVDPVVFPGEVFRDRPVSQVVHRFEGRRLRTRVWFEDSQDAESDRAKAALSAFIRATFPNIDLLAGYWCKVVGQNADGTLELVPDDARLATYSHVPVRYGVPGTSAKVASGARVLLEFAGGEPSRPIATAWESATPTEVVFGGAGSSQPAALATALRTELDALWLALQTHVHPGVQTGSGATGAPTVTKTAQTIASSVVKVKA